MAECRAMKPYRSSRLVRYGPAPAASLLVAFLAGMVGSAGCETNASERHDLARTLIWTQYEGLARSRALALAGDPTKVWVAGMAGGQASVAKAMEAALAACGKQRSRRRIQSPCLPYAEDTRIVWTGISSLPAP
jgi:hypothetical protein